MVKIVVAFEATLDTGNEGAQGRLLGPRQRVAVTWAGSPRKQIEMDVIITCVSYVTVTCLLLQVGFS